MSEASKGTGDAFDAEIVTSDEPTDDNEGRIAAALAAQKEADLAALRAKVERQKQHLAAAEKALADAEQEGV
jgi:hypothetical protein